MSYRAVTHIALIVSPLRQAEEFYRTLFALEVAFREAEITAGWYTLPSDAFTLALEAGASSAGGRLSHIGVQVDTEDLARLKYWGQKGSLAHPWSGAFFLDQVGQAAG